MHRNRLTPDRAIAIVGLVAAKVPRHAILAHVGCDERAARLFVRALGSLPYWWSDERLVRLLGVLPTVGTRGTIRETVSMIAESAGFDREAVHRALSSLGFLPSVTMMLLAERSARTAAQRAARQEADDRRQAALQQIEWAAFLSRRPQAEIRDGAYAATRKEERSAALRPRTLPTDYFERKRA